MKHRKELIIILITCLIITNAISLTYAIQWKKQVNLLYDSLRNHVGTNYRYVNELTQNAIDTSSSFSLATLARAYSNETTLVNHVAHGNYASLPAAIKEQIYHCVMSQNKIRGHLRELSKQLDYSREDIAFLEQLLRLRKAAQDDFEPRMRGGINAKTLVIKYLDLTKQLEEQLSEYF